jgi:molybdopterin-guanine dinucleotide biosynthesis protein A
MGRDKALLEYAGQPLVEHAVRLLKSAGLEPHIVGSRTDLTHYAPVIPDLRETCGPLGGIEAALTATSSNWNVFIPVDLPLLPPIFVCYLQERAAVTRAEATIPTLMGKPEPLCAVYHRDLLGGIKNALEAGDYKAMRGIEKAVKKSIDKFSVEAVAAARDDWFTPTFSATEAERMGHTQAHVPLHRWFQNINTPSDLALVS